MSYYKNAVLTDLGASLLAESVTEGTKIEFVKLQTGSGIYTDEEKQTLQQRTALKELKQEFGFSSAAFAENNTICLKAVINNDDLQEGYHITELGIIAKKEGDESEILYSIAIAEEADYLPSKESPVEIVQDYYTKISNAESVEINVQQGAYATAEDMQAVLYPKFVEDEELSNIESGMSIFTIFGKIQRTIKDFIEHLKNYDNPHKVTPKILGLDKAYIDRGKYAGNIDNLHNQTDIGVYWIRMEDGTTGTIPGDPALNFFILEVISAANGVTLQVATGVCDSVNRKFLRTHVNGKWCDWHYIFEDLSKAAFSGSYNDLSDRPSIPSVGNGTITITQNGTTKGSFTTNQSGNTTIALTDTNTQTVTGVKGNAESAYRTRNVNLTPANIGALPSSYVVYGNTTTVAGYALDARQANPNISGSLAAQINAANTALTTHKTSADHDSRYPLKSDLNKKIRGMNGAVYNVAMLNADMAFSSGTATYSLAAIKKALGVSSFAVTALAMPTSAATVTCTGASVSGTTLTVRARKLNSAGTEPLTDTTSINAIVFYN